MKKLSKYELERALLTLEIVYREANLEKPEKTLQAIEQIKSLIESSAQEPRTELSHIDKLLAHFIGQPDDLGREYVIDWLKEIRGRPQEPSEAEVEEFLEKWTGNLITAFHESNTMHSIKLMLKEYRELPRRG